MEREDSWAGIIKVQEKITETVGYRKPELSGSMLSLNARYAYARVCMETFLPPMPTLVSRCWS